MILIEYRKLRFLSCWVLRVFIFRSLGKLFIIFSMTVKKRNTSKKRKNFQRTVKVTTKAYKDRERACSYKDYLMLITLANFNLHQIRHLQVREILHFERKRLFIV